jgi:hypothetical protein
MPKSDQKRRKVTEKDEFGAFNAHFRVDFRFFTFFRVFRFSFFFAFSSFASRMHRADVQQALTGIPMSRADVFRALCDLGWEPRDAGRMVQTGFGLFGGRERWVFERTLSIVPLALSPRRVELSEHAHGSPDIADDKYVDLLLRRRDDARCSVLLVRAATGMGKTNALKRLLHATSTGALPPRPSFVPRATHVGALMVASTVGEVRAMYQACADCGMRCVFYRDLFQGEEQSVLRGDLRGVAFFTTFHSVPRLVEAITGQRGAIEAYRQEALHTAMTLHRVDQAMMQLVGTWYQCLSAGLVVLDESSRVWSGIIGPLCNPGMVYDVLVAVMRNSDSALMMSANLDDASMYVAVREVGEHSCALYWHFARRPRRCVVYHDVEHFVAVLTRHVYAAVGTEGPPVMLFGDNKRQLRRLGRSVCAHVPERLTLEISSPLGAEIVKRLAAGDRSDLEGKAFVTATGCLSAAVSIHGGVSAVFGYVNGICGPSDVQQMTARVRFTENHYRGALVTTPFVVHVHVALESKKKRRRGSETPVESESDDEHAGETRDEALERYEHNAYTAGELRRFLAAAVGQRPFQQRVDLGSAPDPITRKLAERYNELLAQGLPTLAHMCALEVNDALYHLRAEHFLSLVRGKEFRDAVESDFRMMGYTVALGAADAPVYAASAERRLAASMRRVLMHRRMTNLEREEASEVFCAVRCAYLNEFGEGAEEGARRALMNKLFRALHWRALPDDEEDAWAMLRLFTRHDDNVDEAIRHVRVLEALLSGDGYATGVRQQQYLGRHYYFDPRLREAHITKELWRAMRLASCGETPACTSAPCESCAASLDGPLSTVSIVVPTRCASADEPVDAEALRAFLREQWHTGNEYLRGLRPPRVQELLRCPWHLITWRDFMFLFGRLVVETTGLSWRSSFRASSAARFAMLPSEVPRLRFYAEAIRLRLTIPESDHEHAPMCYPRAKLQRAYEAMAERNGPFEPIAGVE